MFILCVEEAAVLPTVNLFIIVIVTVMASGVKFKMA
jgi:hypothetical protein